MILYGIKVVPPEWEKAMPLPFSKAEHDAAKLEQGTRILLYREGEGIIGEGEVHGFAIHPKEWPAPTTEALPPSLAQADYLQPIGLLYSREDAISPDKVREALGDPAFPQAASWRPIEREVYERLANWPY
ncbi:MAG: hypothetical protein ABI835_14715 [Chloroflexota bacterium]